MNRQLTEKVRDIQQNNELRHFIFSSSELMQRVDEVVERWDWIFPDGHDTNTRNVYEPNDVNPRFHRREARFSTPPLSQNEWFIDTKEKKENGATIWRERKPRPNTYELSQSLQNLITQMVLQPQNPANLEELKTKIRSVHFVRGVGYNLHKPWLVFDKQWLYKQITAPTPDEDFFTIEGIPGSAKNDSELKQFLQREGYFPADHTNQEREGQSSNSILNYNHLSYTWNSPSASENFGHNDDNTSCSSSGPSSVSSNNQEKNNNQSSYIIIDNQFEEKKEPTNLNLTGSSNNDTKTEFKSAEVKEQSSTSVTDFSPQLTSATPTVAKSISEKPNTSLNYSKKFKENLTEPLPSLAEKKEITKQEIEQIIKANPSLSSIIYKENKIGNWKEELDGLASLSEVQAFQKKIVQLAANQNLQNLMRENQINEEDNKKPVIIPIPYLTTAFILLSGLFLISYLVKRKK